MSKNTVYEIKVNPMKTETAVDPSVARLIEQLALALQSHHTGLVTIEPFARTYERDLVLLNQAEDFLMIAQGRSQSWRIPEGLQTEEVTNEHN